MWADRWAGKLSERQLVGIHVGVSMSLHYAVIETMMEDLGFKAEIRKGLQR